MNVDDMFDEPEDQDIDAPSEDNVVPLEPSPEEPAESGSEPKPWENDPAVDEFLANATPEQIEQIPAAIREELKAAGKLPDFSDPDEGNEPSGEEAGELGQQPGLDPNIAALMQQNQMLQQQLQQLQQQMTSLPGQQQAQPEGAEEAPDPFLDPEGFRAHQDRVLEERIANMRLEHSYMSAAKMHGQEAANAAWQQARQEGLDQYFMQQPDPIGAAIDHANSKQQAWALNNLASNPDQALPVLRQIPGFDDFLANLVEQVLESEKGAVRETALKEVQKEVMSMPDSLKQSDIPPSLLDQAGASSSDSGLTDREFTSKLFAN